MTYYMDAFLRPQQARGLPTAERHAKLKLRITRADVMCDRFTDTACTNSHHGWYKISDIERSIQQQPTVLKNKRVKTSLESNENVIVLHGCFQPPNHFLVPTRVEIAFDYEIIKQGELEDQRINQGPQKRC